MTKKRKQKIPKLLYKMMKKMIIEKPFRVIFKLSRAVHTDIDTAPAGYTLASVYLDPRLSVFLLGNAGADRAADVDALVTADTIFICKYNAVFLHVTLLS